MSSAIKDVAIIMDGNGRWATSRRHPRFHGHVRGASIVAPLVEAASDYGLNSLTLYAFSTENFQRPDEEKSVLFKLLKKFLIKEFQRIIKNNIRFRVVGTISALNKETQKIIANLELASAKNTGMKLNFAFGYGGRAEIINAVNRAVNLEERRLITEENFSEFLYDPEVPEIDLLIRTGGDQRVSNFLLWQVAYAELYFSKTLWPDFSIQEFINILSEVKERDRRFGNVDVLQNTSEQSLN